MLVRYLQQYDNFNMLTEVLVKLVQQNRNQQIAILRLKLFYLLWLSRPQQIAS